MFWTISNRADVEANRMAKRHYSCQSPDSVQFMPAGSCLVLKGPGAVWGTSFPLPEYVKHAWAGAWICSIFRDERKVKEPLPSELIREAVAATRWFYRDVPALGMITFVDAQKVESVNPGYCFKKAGFDKVGSTKGGLIALQLLPDDMPVAAAPLGAQFRLAV